MINTKVWKDTLKETIETNKKLHNDGLPASTLCLTGPHGIGKTSVTKETGEEEGMRVVHCDLSQMEVED